MIEVRSNINGMVWRGVASVSRCCGSLSSLGHAVRSATPGLSSLMSSGSQSHIVQETFGVKRRPLTPTFANQSRGVGWEDRSLLREASVGSQCEELPWGAGVGSYCEDLLLGAER